MKKKLIYVCAALFSAIAFTTGCSSEKSFSYRALTGEVIEISIDKSDDYDVSKSEDIPFVISHDGKDESNGKFISSDNYSEYADNLFNDENAEIIDSGETENFEYIFYESDESNYNYLMLIKNSRTGVLLENTTSEKAAKECFEHLDLKLKSK